MDFENIISRRSKNCPYITVANCVQNRTFDMLETIPQHLITPKTLIMNKLLSLSVLLCLMVAAVRAEVKLPALVGDNMVLQQRSDVNIWGEAKANAKVSVKTSWNNKTYSTTSDDNGAWNVVVATPEAGGPYSMTISDGDKITVNNILIGEVWVCSGQSNMNMNVGGYFAQPTAGAMELLMSASPKNNIRLFQVEKKASAEPLDKVKGSWKEATPASVNPFSAVGYHFAYNLRKLFDFPIGMIQTSWGGTRIEAWMPVERTHSVDPNIPAFRKDDQNKAAYLYNAMIKPVSKYGARGFLWYQGEGNTGNGKIYDKLLAEMVAQWRADWGGGEKMPFYYVLLTPYQYKDKNGIGAPITIESMVRAKGIIPNSDYAATTDAGEEFCIHPTAKDKVGLRLALKAAVLTYGIEKGLPCTAPTYKSAKFKDGEAVVSFDNAWGGLNPRDAGMVGFELAGEDKIFHPAKASFDSKIKAIRVTSESVPAPIAVRYAFRNYMDTNVTDNFGQPLVPFRSDSWE